MYGDLGRYSGISHRRHAAVGVASRRARGLSTGDNQGSTFIILERLHPRSSILWAVYPVGPPGETHLFSLSTTVSISIL